MPKARRHSEGIIPTDGRKNNGRKPGTVVSERKKKDKSLTPAKLNKAKRDRIALYGINAVIAEFGSEQAFFEHLAKESRKSYNHLKLLMEYAWGKPDDVERNGKAKVAPVINFFGTPPPQEETIDIDVED